MANSPVLREALDEELARDIAKSAKELALANEAGRPALMPLDAASRRIEEELWNQLKDSDKRCSQGLALFLEVLPELAKLDREIVPEKIEEELLSSLGKIDSLEVAKRWGQEVLDGKNWKDLLAIPESILQRLYQAGKFLLESTRAEEAASLFFFLVTLDRSRPYYWLALGHAQFASSNYHDACKSYESCSLADPEWLDPYFFAAKSYLQQSDYRQAYEWILKALECYQQSGQKDPAIFGELQELQVFIKNHL
jgi:tetratricopeptide (TPR) repeat protein